MTNLQHIMKMAHSPVRNYGVPGLTSYLIGGPPGPHGCVRLFHSGRHQQETLTPHSHRFDFQSLVLQGSVVNRVWVKDEKGGDNFAVSMQTYKNMGNYETRVLETSKWAFSDTTYTRDDTYAMKSTEVHSIFFGKDTYVLFFEGPKLSDTSIILEPWVDCLRIPTMRVESWMFEKGN